MPPCPPKYSKILGCLYTSPMCISPLPRPRVLETWWNTDTIWSNAIYFVDLLVWICFVRVLWHLKLLLASGELLLEVPLSKSYACSCQIANQLWICKQALPRLLSWAKYLLLSIYQLICDCSVWGAWFVKTSGLYLSIRIPRNKMNYSAYQVVCYPDKVH